jgi:Domain of unknown function (DUF4388)
MLSSDRNVELQGKIREFSVPDVVQFLCGQGKTGKLALVFPQASGWIFFDEGAVAHAELGAREGEEAFFELMSRKEGSFEFAPGERSGKKSIRNHTTILLLEGARRSDERELLEEQIPDTNLIPEFILPEDGQTGKQVTLNTSEWMVLAKIDGRRSVKQIALDSGLSEYHICRLLYPLVANHLIRLRAPSPPPR